MSSSETRRLWRIQRKRPEEELRSSRGIITLQDQYFSRIMDVKTAKNPTPIPGKKVEFHQTLTQGHGKKMLFSASYFSLESLFLLVFLTASLLILPLILPPLPPPPFMLLLLPICIMAVLMILAFTPCNVRDVTSTCM